MTGYIFHGRNVKILGACTLLGSVLFLAGCHHSGTSLPVDIPDTDTSAPANTFVSQIESLLGITPAPSTPVPEAGSPSSSQVDSSRESSFAELTGVSAYIPVNNPFASQITDPMQYAMATGNSSGVTTDQVGTYLDNYINAIRDRFSGIRNTLYGLNSDGTSNSGSLPAITWAIPRQSFFITSTNDEQNYGALITNKTTDTSKTTARILPVVQAGVLVGTTGGRYGVYGSNPMVIRGNAAMDSFVLNHIRWLTGQTSLTGLKVATAYLPGTENKTFNHETTTHNWLKSFIPQVVINNVSSGPVAENLCDSNLTSCLATAQLLVIGIDEAVTDPVVASNIASQLATAQKAGVPVMVVSHGYTPTALTTAFSSLFQIGFTSNYWWLDYVNAADSSSLGKLPANLASVQQLISRLKTGLWETTWSGCVKSGSKWRCDYLNATNPGDAAYIKEFQSFMPAYRTYLNTLDSTHTNLFELPERTVEKALVLLGDKYRQQVSYPIDNNKDTPRFYRALFSDYTLFNSRTYNAVATNLGNFSNTFSPTETVYAAKVQVSSPLINQTVEYMSGLYVMPGRPVRITRTDSSPVNVRIGVNMLRAGTTWSFDVLDRPDNPTSPRMTLAAGETVEFTSAIGGPLFFFVDKDATQTDAVTGVALAAKTTFDVDGIITFPVFRGDLSETGIASFKQALAGNKTNWVGISTPFLTIHSTKPFWQQTMTAYNGDLPLLMSEISTYMIKDTYNLAGFNSADGSLSLNSSVSSYCERMQWDCTSIIHRRDSMQHVIADKTVAGTAASGNPYDQTWALKPIGWGESHEIGHNLQTSWTKFYGGLSGESSNNIFPIHKMISHNRDPLVPLNRKDTSSTSTKLVFDFIKAGFNQTAKTQSDYAYDYIYGSIDNAGSGKDNERRLQIYAQLPMLARYYNSALMPDGWDLYTYIYLNERQVRTFSKDAIKWTMYRDRLGFSTYAANAGFDSSPNDYMLIVTSMLIGRDLTDYYAMWGIKTSAAAQAQVKTFNLPKAELLVFPVKNGVLSDGDSQIGTPVVMSRDAVYPAGYQ